MERLTTYYLEMHDPSELNAREAVDGIVLRECKVKQFEFNRFLYELVGRKWRWHEKYVWTDRQWAEYVERDQLRTWVAYDEGTVAGYFELQKDGGDVEIIYFGLTEKYIGKGIGGYMLTEAIRRAWEWGARRVWVHTCTRDHPVALKHYQARGMKLYKTETKEL